MIVSKITLGYVIQKYDTDKRQFISQEFIAGDECDFEDKEGESVSEDIVNTIYDEYLPYDMKQPT